MIEKVQVLCNIKLCRQNFSEFILSAEGTNASANGTKHARGGLGAHPPWKILKNGGCRCILRASETYISKNFKLILGAKIVIFEIKLVIFETKIVITFDWIDGFSKFENSQFHGEIISLNFVHFC